MTKHELINRALNNNEIKADVAGQILMLGDDAIIQALENNEIELDLAGQLMMLEK